MASFESAGSRVPRLTLEELDQQVIHYERTREPGPFLAALINYLRVGKFKRASAEALCLTLSERIAESNTDSDEMKEDKELRKRRGAYGMRELAAALLKIGQGGNLSTESVIIRLIRELDKCGREEDRMIRSAAKTKP